MRMRCENCGLPSIGKQVLIRAHGVFVATGTVYYCDADCLDALERKWRTHDPEPALSLREFMPTGGFQ